MSPSSPARTLSSLLLASAGAAAPLAAQDNRSTQGIRLSGDMALGFDGDVLADELAPDGGRVVYLASREVVNLYELFSVPFDRNSAPVRLNEPGYLVLAFGISPDGARVVYRESRSSGIELFSVPIAGGARVALSGPMVAGGGVGNNNLMSRGFWISPDGSRVVYLADQDTNDVIELYSVPIDGSAVPVKLNGALVAGGDVSDLWTESSLFSADGARVVFKADASVDERLDLFSAPADGSQPATELSDVTISDGDVRYVRLTADRAVYDADPTVDGRHELFSVPLDGSAPPVRLHGLHPDRDVSTFRISGDGTRVAFTADFEVAGRNELYAVPIDGAQPPLKLNAPTTSSVVLSAIGPVDDPRRVRTGSGIFSVPIDLSTGAVQLGGPQGYRLAFSPDATRVVFDALENLDVGLELYSAPLDASAPPVKLSPAGGIRLFQCAGERVAFTGVNDALFHRPIDGSQAAVQVDGPFRSRSYYTPFQLTADGGGLTFTSDRPAGAQIQVFSILTDGSRPSLLLNDPLPGGAWGNVLSVETSPDGRRAVYCADERTDQVFELFGVRTDGGSPSVRLNHTLVGSADVHPSFTIDPTGERVVYRAGNLTGALEVFSVPVDRSQPPVKLSGSLKSYAGLGLQPDLQGSRVVFTARVSVGARLDLYSAPLDGGAPAIRINDPVTAGAIQDPAPDGTPGFAITPDGSRVVYTAFAPSNGPVQLYVAPIDGSTAPLPVSGTIVSGGAVGPFAILPDSSAVIYRADAEVNERFELYCGSLDGAPPMKLNAPLVQGGDVSSFLVTGDGARAVYLADQASDELFELHSVPVDGSQPPLTLSGTLDPESDVGQFASTSDGVFVVFLAAQDEVLQLFRVPSDGSALPTSLDRGTVSGITEFVLSPSGARVFFRAELEVDGIFELFSVPLTGGAAPALLSTRHVLMDVHTGFRGTRDGQKCVFTADQDMNGIAELYVAPADGSQPARKLNAALVPGGEVVEFELAADGVVYRADQDQDGMVELYASLFGHAGRRTLR